MVGDFEIVLAFFGEVLFVVECEVAFDHQAHDALKDCAVDAVVAIVAKPKVARKREVLEGPFNKVLVVHGKSIPWILCGGAQDDFVSRELFEDADGRGMSTKGFDKSRFGFAFEVVPFGQQVDDGGTERTVGCESCPTLSIRAIAVLADGDGVLARGGGKEFFAFVCVECAEPRLHDVVLFAEGEVVAECGALCVVELLDAGVEEALDFVDFDARTHASMEKFHEGRVSVVDGALCAGADPFVACVAFVFGLVVASVFLSPVWVGEHVAFGFFLAEQEGGTFLADAIA